MARTRRKLPIDPTELRQQIRIYQTRIRETEAARRRRIPASGKRARPRGSRCPERLAEMILALCTRLAEHQSFTNYTFKADMIQNGAIDCIKAATKFDLNRTTDGRPASAFAYLSQTAWRGFCLTIQREAKRGFTCLGETRPDVEAWEPLALGSFAERASDGLLPARGGYHRVEA